MGAAPEKCRSVIKALPSRERQRRINLMREFAIHDARSLAVKRRRHNRPAVVRLSANSSKHRRSGCHGQPATAMIANRGSATGQIGASEVAQVNGVIIAKHLQRGIRVRPSGSPSPCVGQSTIVIRRQPIQELANSARNIWRPLQCGHATEQPTSPWFSGYRLTHFRLADRPRPTGILSCLSLVMRRATHYCLHHRVFQWLWAKISDACGRSP